MKIKLSTEEIRKIVVDHLNTTIPGPYPWVSETADYAWPSSLEFTEDTPERREKEADWNRRVEKTRLEMEREAAERKAAPVEPAISEQPGNF